MKFELLALSSLMLASVAPAMAQSAPQTDPAQVQGGTYAVEPYHTKVLFGVSHFGFSTYYGAFNQSSGSLEFDPAHPDKSQLDVTVKTGSVSTGNEKLDGELKSADWLDAGKDPGIVFKSTSIAMTGKDTGKVSGNLTLHGVTKPETLDVTFNGGGVNPIDKKYTIGFEATGTIKRSDFGVVKYLPGVGDDVRLIISGAFEK